MKSRKGIRQILVVRNGEKPPPPQYGYIPQREVGCKSWPFLLHSLKLGIAKCIALIICELAQMKIYPPFNCPRFCVACCLFEIPCQECHNLIWDRISLYDLIAIVVFFNQWQLFREIEVAGILWRGQRTASCFLTMRRTMDSRDRVEKIVQV